MHKIWLITWRINWRGSTMNRGKGWPQPREWQRKLQLQRQENKEPTFTTKRPKGSNISSSVIGHVLENKSNLNEVTGLKSFRGYPLTVEKSILEIHNRNITKESASIWKLSNMLLNNQWIKSQITLEIIKYFVLRDNKNAIKHNDILRLQCGCYMGGGQQWGDPGN